MPTARSLLTTLALLTALAPIPSSAQTPDLSGTWVLDLAKSSFGEMPGGPRTDVINHRGTSLRIQRSLTGPNGESVSATLNFTIDGQPHQNSIGGNEITSRLRWDGSVLVIEGQAKGSQGEFRVVDRYVLAPDRSTLTVSRRVIVADEEMAQTMVFGRR